MNKLTIIGNLTKDPELRTTESGVSVCDFTVAVNRRPTKQQKDSGEKPVADYFRVSAWRERGELCAKYLSKGSKVCVVGPVSVRTYTVANSGETRASLEVNAEDVEFVGSRNSGQDNATPASQQSNAEQQPAASGGFTAVETDELPF